MRKIAALPVRLYRLVVSPAMGPRCRFHPSCSVYALEALERHGVIRGGVLSLFRLLRCHPWGGRGGLDPVPERFAWRGLIHYKRRTSFRGADTRDFP